MASFQAANDLLLRFGFGCLHDLLSKGNCWGLSTLLHDSLMNTVLKERLENLDEFFDNLRNWSVHNLFSGSLRDPVLRHDLGNFDGLLRRLSLYHDRDANRSTKGLNL